jgi:hypothetical protein
LEYFTNFFSIFATQCFLLTTFVVVAISQRPPDKTISVCGDDCPLYMMLPFAVFQASCVALNMILILIAVFVTVFGNWLAIHGKEGAMIYVIEGMVAEQNKIVGIFLVSAFLFQGQIFIAYFVLMRRQFAAICATIMCLFAIWTYRSALRIYNNFKFDESHAGWRFDVRKESRELSALHPDFIEELINASGENNSTKIKQLYQQSIQAGTLKAEDTIDKKRNVILEMLASSVERVSESISARMSFRGSLPNLPSVKMPEISMPNIRTSFSMRDSTSQKELPPSDHPRGSFRGSLPDIARPSFRGSLQDLARPSFRGSLPEEARSSHRGSQSEAPRPSLRGSLVENVRQSFNLRASLGAIGTGLSFANPLSFSLRPSQREQEIEMDAYGVAQMPVVVGPLTVKLVPHSPPSLLAFFTSPQTERWMKHYFVLKGALLFYYENEFSFIISPDKPLNKALPIDLAAYELKRGPATAPFPFTLRPLSSADNLKTWRFRAGDLNTFQHWCERIEAVLEEIQSRELAKEFL